MEAIVKSENKAYEKYEELLVRRDNYRKEAELCRYEFIRVFGDYITEAFKLKIECIKKKKIIAYCQKLENQGKKIISSNLDDYIKKEMFEYQAELDSMIEDVKNAKLAGALSAHSLKRIKEIYYALVKLLHPDLHPELAHDEKIKEFWKQIEIAYRHNQLDELEDLEVVVKGYLNKNGYENLEIEVEDVEAKIGKVEAEITKIITTNPYLYRIILNDEKAYHEKKAEYLEEIDSYKKYSETLDEIIARFKIEEMYS